MMYRTHPEYEYEWLGGFNTPPAGLVEIDEGLFWQTFASSRIPKFRFIKQIFDYIPELDIGAKRRLTELNCWMYDDDTCIGWVRNVEGALPAKPKVFFRAARCDHVYGDREIIDYSQKFTCRKCGYSYRIPLPD